MIFKRARHMSAILAAVVFICGLLGAASVRAEAGPQVRQSLDLSDGWRFRFGGAGDSAAAPDYDDSAWSKVSIPHTWNRIGEYGLSRSASGNAEQGEGWYRLILTAPMRGADERYFLQFDGVGNVATVWVNGVRAGEHKGAFSRFRIDVTAQLRPGARNVIAVRADNSKPAPGSATEDVIPLSGDFFVHGGLYRGVSLITANSAQIDMLDYGGPGVYLRTRTLDSKAADIELLVRLRNLGTGGRNLSLIATILDSSGRSVASDAAPVKLKGKSALEVRRVIRLQNPRLWRGRADPYIYTVVVELRSGDHAIDRVAQPLGVRSFNFDANKGFVLNGESMRLYGASRHQDRADKGWALSREDYAQDMALMKEMGLNAIRHAHYQHAQEWAEEADKTGMVVWAELPFVHESSLTEAPPTSALIENAKSQLIELIRQNYNHPSIMIWSVGNEADIGAAITAMRSGKDGPPAQSLDMLKTLNALARKEDDSRPTAYADCCEGTPLQLKNSETLSGVTEISAYNRYFGWYYGSPEMVGEALDGFHAKYPSNPIMLSEYGAGGAMTQFTDNPEGGPVNAYGRPHPEQYQSWLHEKTWSALESRTYLAGAWIWAMFDFGSTMREEGDAIDLNDKGLVSYDRKTRKDAFYFYKAHLSDDPVLYITGRRYIDRAYPVTDVRVYSNAERAVLSVNGKSLGGADCLKRICLWRNVGLAPGVNKVSVSADFNGRKESDQVVWTAPDRALGMNIRAGSLTGLLTSDGRRFGSDAFFAGGAARNLIPFGPGAKMGGTVASADPALYDSYREGDFRYELPVPNGRWFVTLRMFEPEPSKAKSRSFDVRANGRRVLTDFNPAKAAGGALKGVARRFPVVVSKGRLNLDFKSSKEGAVISAIEVTH